MSNTLIEANKLVFTEDLRNKIATLLGEREGDVRKAIDASSPAVLTAILKRTESPDGPQAIYNLARQAAGNDLHGHFHELATGTGGLVVGNTLSGKGSDYFKAIAGDRAEHLVQAITRYANVKVDSAAFILGLASFVSLDAMGRHILNGNLDVPTFNRWLWSQRDSIVGAIPSGLDVPAALGLKRLPGSKETTSSRRNSVIYGVIAIIILIGILFFVFKSCNRSTAYTNSSTDTTVANVPADSNRIDTTSNTRVTLPDGTVLAADKGGTEDRLVAFLNDPNQKIDKEHATWFEFSKVGFASNSAQLLLESEAQLHNIMAILKAFPKARIRIGAYTDNTGDSTQNMRLSQDRADAVNTKLKDLGASGHQLDGAKGYGSQYPVGDNGTPEGRAMNRRMALEVRDK